MPRTKQPRKTRTSRETTEESDSLVRDFERQTAEKIRNIEVNVRMQINSYETSVNIALSYLPTEIKKLTLGEYSAVDLPGNDENENNSNSADGTDQSSITLSVPPTTVGKTKKKGGRATGVSDDGYATESTIAKTSHVSRMHSVRNSEKRPGRRVRSSSQTSSITEKKPRGTRSSSRNRITKCNSDLGQENRNDLLKSSGHCPTVGRYKTPSLKNNPAPCFSVVTPKVKPNTPMNILRRPREGEMVLSMQGSPLLVSSIINERTANINVPLTNGSVISLLPNAGLRLSHVPPLDEETMSQLKMLQGNLNKVLGNK